MHYTLRRRQQENSEMDLLECKTDSPLGHPSQGAANKLGPNANSDNFHPVCNIGHNKSGPGTITLVTTRRVPVPSAWASS